MNLERKLLTMLCGKTMDQDDMKKLNDDHFVKEFFRGVGILKKLQLQVPEIGLLQGIVILSTGKSL